MKLTAQPQVALADEKVSISVSGLAPASKVKLSASLCFPWAPGIPLESSAWFTADAGGKVDLSTKKPESGSYGFVDGMGLIASVMPKDQKAWGKLGEHISAEKNMFIDIRAESGPATASLQLERQFRSVDVKSQKITEGIVGELYYSDQKSDKTLIVLGGSGGGLGPILPMAALLASRGFNVLALAYFQEKGLPGQLAQIPLEYFEKAFAWLAANPITKGTELYVFGTSKGAELALLLASRYPSIHRVVVNAPHAYCFQGLNFKTVSSWTYQGKDLPFIKLKNTVLFGNMISCFLKNEPFEYAYTYRKGLAAAVNKEEARIRVENSNADLLMFTTKDCGMWNTYDGCMILMDTLRRCQYSHCYDLVVYEDAGEPYYAPYIIPAGLSRARIAPRLVLSVGGTLQGNARCQADSWQRMIEFFKK